MYYMQLSNFILISIMCDVMAPLDIVFLIAFPVFW